MFESEEPREKMQVSEGKVKERVSEEISLTNSVVIPFYILIVQEVLSIQVSSVQFSYG